MECIMNEPHCILSILKMKIGPHSRIESESGMQNRKLVLNYFFWARLNACIFYSRIGVVCSTSFPFVQNIFYWTFCHLLLYCLCWLFCLESVHTAQCTCNIISFCFLAFKLCSLDFVRYKFEHMQMPMVTKWECVCVCVTVIMTREWRRMKMRMESVFVHCALCTLNNI